MTEIFVFYEPDFADELEKNCQYCGGLRPENNTGCERQQTLLAEKMHSCYFTNELETLAALSHNCDVCNDRGRQPETERIGPRYSYLWRAGSQ